MDLVASVKKLLAVLPKKVKVGTQYVGAGEPVFVIAEIGINHNGDLEIAKRLIDAAAEAGANAVKFQKRTVSEVYIKDELEKPRKASFALGATNREHRERLEFSTEQYKELIEYAKKRGVLFFASVWDERSADVMESLGTAAYKIASADLDNLPLIEYVAKKGRPILLSTGMSTLPEIREAVRAALAHNNLLVIFHCLSLYPSPHEHLHLRFIDTLHEHFAPLPIGYSGHETDLVPTLAAVARGAHIVERHLTLDRTMPGTDHAGSLEPHEFTELVAAIRTVEKVLGSAQKPLLEELKPLREKLAKSIVTRIPIQKGTVIKKSMLAAKSPGSGISPARLGDIIDRVAAYDLPEDTLLPTAALTWKY